MSVSPTNTRSDGKSTASKLVSTMAVVGVVSFGAVTLTALAHDRALEIGRNHRESIKSRAPMLVLMVILTVSGLWSLSAGMASA